MLSKNELVESEDFCFNQHGYMVFSQKYLLARGECCGNGCQNCPYQYENVADPLRSKLVAQGRLNNGLYEDR